MVMCVRSVHIYLSHPHPPPTVDCTLGWVIGELVYSVAFNPDGKIFANGSFDKILHIRITSGFCRRGGYYGRSGGAEGYTRCVGIRMEIK